MKSIIAPLIAGLLALTPFFCVAQPDQTAETSPVETKEERDARMAWWREAKFGMFIHWGVYAVPAGTWDGKPIGGIGEWIMLRGKIPVSEYRAFARDFNPVKYDPQAWAKLAREAGMKYIVITAKHHDGFALYPSDVTDWDIADATPYGKDLLTPLATATRKQGLKFGTYYSQAQDWTHPGGAKSGYKEGEGWDDAHKGNFDDYLTKIAVPQSREILARIKPDVLWWDTPTWMTAERAKPLDELLALRPKLITNNRLGGGYKGDTETPEQHIPATGFGDRDWETCMTMNDHWGWNKHDKNWKSSQELIRTLVDIASKGGNYLLNVGPTEAGEFPPEAVERLVEIGRWMEHHGESIYGTSASIVPAFAWGRCTVRREAENTVVYLHAFEPGASGLLRVDGVSGEVLSVELLGSSRSRLSQKFENGALVVDARGVDLVGPCPVVKVVFAGTPQVFEPPVISAPGEFIGSSTVHIGSRDEDVDIRYTLDGSDPTSDSLLVSNLFVEIDRSATIRARCFIGREAVSGVASRTLTRVEPIPPVEPVAPRAGLALEVYRGEWDRIPDLSSLTPSERTTTPRLEVPPEYRVERVMLRFTGFIEVHTPGMYRFSITSDDGSRLTIAGRTIDNDGAHVAESREGYIPLAEGLHPITVVWFNRTGDHALGVSWGREHHDLLPVPGGVLRR